MADEIILGEARGSNPQTKWLLAALAAAILSLAGYGWSTVRDGSVTALAKAAGLETRMAVSEARAESREEATNRRLDETNRRLESIERMLTRMLSNDRGKREDR